MKTLVEKFDKFAKLKELKKGMNHLVHNPNNQKEYNFTKSLFDEYFCDPSMFEAIKKIMINLENEDVSLDLKNKLKTRVDLFRTFYLKGENEAKKTIEYNKNYPITKEFPELSHDLENYLHDFKTFITEENFYQEEYLKLRTKYNMLKNRNSDIKLNEIFSLEDDSFKRKYENSIKNLNGIGISENQKEFNYKNLVFDEIEKDFKLIDSIIQVEESIPTDTFKTNYESELKLTIDYTNREIRLEYSQEKGDICKYKPSKLQNFSV